MEDMPGFDVSHDCVGWPPLENMSGFTGSNDYTESPPVGNVSGFKDSGDHIELPPVEKMSWFKDCSDSLKFPVGENMSGFKDSGNDIELPPVRNMSTGFKDSGDCLKFPPGLRFLPTDEEIITYYLCGKIADSSFCATAIAEVDLKSHDPWDFPGVSVGEKEWFFYYRRDMKYATGQRTNRATHSGYWKTTGKDRGIFKGKTLVGMKKTLIFCKGRAPRGERTGWVMHEYRLVDNLPQNAKNEWVICKVFLRSSVVEKTDISGIMAENCSQELMRPSMMPYLLLMSILQTTQTVAKASNVEHDTSVDSINVADIEKNVGKPLDTTHKRKKDNDEYVGGVRQQKIHLPKKLQQSNLGAENAAASSCSVSSHNNITMKDNSRVWVKVGYNNDIVMFMLPFATMDTLKTEILKRYKLEDETIKIRYKDEDEEMVTIACDEDLHYCLEFFKSTGRAPVRLSL